jgi:Mechanosensitive ion channel
VSSVRVCLVVEASHRGEDPPSTEVPLLDLVVVALDVLAKPFQVGPKPLLHRVEPDVTRVAIWVDPGENEQVVLDLFEHERIHVLLCLRPVWYLAGIERHKLDGVSGLLGACERCLGGRRQVRLPRGEGMLELVVGKLLQLAVVTLGDEFHVRLALSVARELTVDDLPADRLPVLERAERVAEARRVEPVAPERACFDTPGRVPKEKAIPRELCERAGRHPTVWCLHTLHKPVTTVPHDDVTRLELLLGRILEYTLVTRASDDELVSQDCAHRGARNGTPAAVLIAAPASVLPIGALPDHVDRLLWGALAILIAVALSRAVKWIVRRLEQRHPGEERELLQLRRRETALVLLATAIPYATAIVVLIVVASFFLPAAVLGGSAFVAIVLAFAAQRFLMDVIAGALIAFERWYGVGDFVVVEPAKVSGFVEQFGLRTTVLRSLNGDRVFAPNSQIITAIRAKHGYRRYSIELLTTDPADARRAIEAAARRAPAGEARFLRAPRVVEERELGEGTWLVRGRADVAPTMEWLAERYLVEELKAWVSDSLLTDPIVYTLDEDALSRYERRVLVR